MKKVVVQEESSEGSDVEFIDSKKSNKNEEKDSKSDGHPQDPQKVHKAENPPVNRFVEEIPKNSPITQIPKPNANKIEKMNENENIFTLTKISEQDHFTNLLQNKRIQDISDHGDASTIVELSKSKIRSDKRKAYKKRLQKLKKELVSNEILDCKNKVETLSGNNNPDGKSDENLFKHEGKIKNGHILDDNRKLAKESQKKDFLIRSLQKQLEKKEIDVVNLERINKCRRDNAKTHYKNTSDAQFESCDSSNSQYSDVGDVLNDDDLQEHDYFTQSNVTKEFVTLLHNALRVNFGNNVIMDLEAIKYQVYDFI